MEKVFTERAVEGLVPDIILEYLWSGTVCAEALSDEDALSISLTAAEVDGWPLQVIDCEGRRECVHLVGFDAVDCELSVARRANCLFMTMKGLNR